MKTTRNLILAIALCTSTPALGLISTTTTRNDYVANGSSTAFGFTFAATQSSTVQVQLNGVVQGPGFSVALNGDQASSPGGTVTFTSPPPSNYTVRIQRVVPVGLQGAHFAPYSAFPASTMEGSLDAIVRQVQQVDRDRADLSASTASSLSSEASARAGGDTQLNAQIGEQLAAVRGLNGFTSIGDSATVLSTGSSAARTLADRFTDVVSVKDFHANGDGTDATTAINSALTAASSGATVDVPRGTYVISGAGLTISKPVTFRMAKGAILTSTATGGAALNISSSTVKVEGGKITLTGDGAHGVGLSGNISDVTVQGVNIVGECNIGHNQQAITNPNGQTLVGLKYLGNTISCTTVGINAQADGSGTLFDALIDGNAISTIVGTGTGTGYAVHVATSDAPPGVYAVGKAYGVGTLTSNAGNMYRLTDPLTGSKLSVTAPTGTSTSADNGGSWVWVAALPAAAGVGSYIRITNNRIDLAQRHSIYLARGRGYYLAGNQVSKHRFAVTDGSFRPAFNISRVSDVVVGPGNSCTDCYDGVLGIGGSGDPTIPLGLATNVTVDGMIVRNWHSSQAFQVGDQAPLVNDTTDITIKNCQLTVDGAVVGSDIATAGTIYFGKRVRIEGNTVNILNATVAQTAFVLAGATDPSAYATGQSNVQYPVGVTVLNASKWYWLKSPFTGTGLSVTAPTGTGESADNGGVWMFYGTVETGNVYSDEIKFSGNHIHMTGHTSNTAFRLNSQFCGGGASGPRLEFNDNRSDAPFTFSLASSQTNTNIFARNSPLDTTGGSALTLSQLTPGFLSNDRGDSPVTLVYGVDAEVQLFNTPLTTVRAITLAGGTNVTQGSHFHIVRTAAATGGSALNLGTGPLKAMAVGTWADVTWTGAAWTLTGYGAL